MRISDWSSDVCSSDLQRPLAAEALVDRHQPGGLELGQVARQVALAQPAHGFEEAELDQLGAAEHGQDRQPRRFVDQPVDGEDRVDRILGFVLHASAASRSEEHTSELQSLMRLSYAVFRLK